MKVRVNAKLNLTLNLGEVVNGYHLIDSVAVSVDVYDVVEAYARCDNQVTVKGLPIFQTTATLPTLRLAGS